MADTPDAPSTLALVTSGVLRLLSRLPDRPSVVRVRADGVGVEVEWAPAPPAPAPANAAGPEGRRRSVTSPTVGIYAAGRDAESAPLVAVGDAVERGQVVAVVRQLRLAIPVKADVAGTVIEVLREDGEPVEHDQPLLVLEVD